MTNWTNSVRYRAVTWLVLAAGLAYLCRNTIGVAESSIRDELDLSLEQSGWMLGAFFWTYAIFQIPSGSLAARFGTRLTLAIFALTWCLSSIGMGLAPAFIVLVAAQLLMGVSQAGIFPASCQSIGHWMPISERSTACGTLAAGMQIGAIVASALAAALLVLVGWRSLFIVLAIPGIFWAILFYIRFRDHPNEVSSVTPGELAMINAGRPDSESGDDRTGGEETNSGSDEAGWMALLGSPLIWLLCSQQICRAAGYMFFASWFPTFLQKTRDVSVAGSGYIQSLVLSGTLVGCLCGGVVTDWIWRRSGDLRKSRCHVGAVALGACAFLIFSAWFVHDVTSAIILLTLGSFFAALAGPCAFAATIDIGGSRTPQVFGLMNMCGNFAAAACPILVGKLFATLSNWNVVLGLFAAVYVIGSASWLVAAKIPTPSQTD